MIELVQLEQLAAFQRCGTLSKAAEELHISQPALSRSMQKLEGDLQVTLFERQKNKLALNANGMLAVEYAEKVLGQVHDFINGVRSFDRASRTISIGSCAPAPFWEILPSLSMLYPEMTISSEMGSCENLLEGLKSDLYQMIVLPYPIDESGIGCIEYGQEHLMFSLPPGHALSGAKELYLKDLDGETMLLYSQIGFWRDCHIKKMPSTHFLLQSEQSAFNTLVEVSALPAFTSDVVIRSYGRPVNRIVIPILDEEVNVTYYVLYKTEHKHSLSLFLDEIQEKNRRTDI